MTEDVMEEVAKKVRGLGPRVSNVEQQLEVVDALAQRVRELEATLATIQARARMIFVVCAQPIWEGGAIGGEDPPGGCELITTPHNHEAIGSFLREQAEWWIGTEEDGETCVALDVTITLEKEEDA